MGHLSFEDVRGLVGYLGDLGIDALYLSPFLRARLNSTHGYDIVDHGQVDPALGTEEEFRGLAEAARSRDMGVVVDIVPNHMSIDDAHNGWWQDVLENGSSSKYANYFDIDWAPPKAALQGKILLAFLGDQFGKTLEDQQLQLVYQDQRFMIRYYERLFPTDPRSWVAVLKLTLEQAVRALEAANPQRLELESIVTGLEHLPARGELAAEALQERYREKEVARRRLGVLLHGSKEIREALASALDTFNGVRGEPESFNRLEAFLNEQAYRLCYWRVATDEINYRRFFDVDTLAAIRVEEPEVFDAVHALPLKFVAEGLITGLRIDHADGLLDPQNYLTTLADRARTAAAAANKTIPYLVVEKNPLARREAAERLARPGNDGLQLPELAERTICRAARLVRGAGRVLAFHRPSHQFSAGLVLGQAHDPFDLAEQRVVCVVQPTGAHCRAASLVARFHPGIALPVAARSGGLFPGLSHLSAAGQR